MMNRMPADLVLEPLDERFSVCKVTDYSGISAGQRYCFTGSTDTENSLVCRTEDVPDNTTAREDGWRCFRIRGELAFYLTGILAGIAGILAEHDISIFAVSTYNTDNVFIKEELFEKALDVLRQEGYTTGE